MSETKCPHGRPDANLCRECYFNEPFTPADQLTPNESVAVHAFIDHLRETTTTPQQPCPECGVGEVHRGQMGSAKCMACGWIRSAYPGNDSAHTVSKPEGAREYFIGKRSGMLMHRRPANETEADLVICLVERSALTACEAKLAEALATSEHRYKWAMAVQAKWGSAEAQLQAERERKECVCGPERNDIRAVVYRKERDAARAEAKFQQDNCQEQWRMWLEARKDLTEAVQALRDYVDDKEDAYVDVERVFAKHRAALAGEGGDADAKE